MKPLVTIVCLTFLAVVNAAGSEPQTDDPDVRTAVERALPYLEEEGTWWIEEKKCVSCHHSSFFVWAKDLALEQGFSVDKETLNQQRQWVIDSMLSPIEPDPKRPENQPKPGELKGDRNVEGVSQLLLSASAKHLPEESREALLEIVSRNREDGDKWKPGGQLPRQERPEAETQAVSSQWALAALGEKSRDSVQIDAETTEWFAMNLLLTNDENSIESLLGRQNEDGGWSWIDGEKSDPEATGQALFALGRARENDLNKEASEAIARGREFLVGAQTKSGFWDTKSTKDREDSTRVSDFWGSVWAVIGLLESES